MTQPSHAATPDAQTRSDARRLIDSLADLGSVAVAFSGGVDSSVVAAAAARADLQRADPDRAVAVTAQSPSVAEWQLQWARRIANEIGIRHCVIETKELSRSEYARNNTRRCYFCKETLYGAISQITEQFGGAAIVSGTNADDLGDYRPGIEAGRIAGVRTPLADLGITKLRVRALASLFELSNQSLPASPCLSSRVAYGVEVTAARLHRIEQAESWLREQGFHDLRVRLHDGELARIELTEDDLSRALDATFARKLNATFREFGFRFVTVDLGGLESGSMNRELVSLGIAPRASFSHTGPFANGPFANGETR